MWLSQLSKSSQMRKIILLVSFLASFASADYLYETLNICVKEYYYKPLTGAYYYVRSDTGATVTGTTKTIQLHLFDGFDYNSTSGYCVRSPLNNTLKIENNQYSFLMAFSGLICGTLLAVSSLIAIRP